MVIKALARKRPGEGEGKRAEKPMRPVFQVLFQPIGRSMTGEITYDLVMEDGMAFVEGCYRLPNGSWQVFIVGKAPVARMEIKPCRWSSGVTGVVIRFPRSVRLNKHLVEQAIGEWLGVDEWRAVRGPDSIQLR
jgi:hypothetical protein